MSEEKDPIDSICGEYAVLTQAERVEEEGGPALQDVIATHRHLHLPGIEEVEALAMLLLELADKRNQHHLVPANLRQKIVAAASSLLEHDKTAANFVKKYESRWGYILFGRCLGADTAENRAAQKTKCAWMRYAQAAQVTEETRLLYLLIKMLKNRPPASVKSSPSRMTTEIKSQYQRIADRVWDDPILSKLSIPLPNLNAKSISNFIVKEEKKANYKATVIPKVKPHKTVLPTEPAPEAPSLPTSLPSPDRPQVQYQSLQHMSGKRRGEKRKLEPEPVNRPIQPKPATYIPPRVSAAPVLLVVPAQPQAPSMMLPVPGTSCGQVSAGFRPVVPPPVLASKPIKPHRSLKPCACCHIPNCGGQRKRYQPPKEKVAGSRQKIFTFCPTSKKSTTSGFEGVVYESFDHFKKGGG
ncbi:uncharacterized protein [Branchiostoma lanceolatum]|uniref:uncharacterized protein n=1 Tax=Branchiostoma lanceolatum TaxID=7740 RepID=UPI0034566230